MQSAYIWEGVCDHIRGPQRLVIKDRIGIYLNCNNDDHITIVETLPCTDVIIRDEWEKIDNNFPDEMDPKMIYYACGIFIKESEKDACFDYLHQRQFKLV